MLTAEKYERTMYSHKVLSSDYGWVLLLNHKIGRTKFSLLIIEFNVKRKEEIFRRKVTQNQAYLYLCIHYIIRKYFLQGKIADDELFFNYYVGRANSFSKTANLFKNSFLISSKICKIRRRKTIKIPARINQVSDRGHFLSSSLFILPESC